MTDQLTVRNEGEGEVRNDCQVSNLGNRAGEGPFIEMMSPRIEAGLRGPY